MLLLSSYSCIMLLRRNTIYLRSTLALICPWHENLFVFMLIKHVNKCKYLYRSCYLLCFCQFLHLDAFQRIKQTISKTHLCICARLNLVINYLQDFNRFLVAFANFDESDVQLKLCLPVEAINTI